MSVFGADAPTVTLSVTRRTLPADFPCALHIPASRTLTLYYPKWLPGEQADRPDHRLTGLKSPQTERPEWRAICSTVHVSVGGSRGENEVTADLDYASAGRQNLIQSSSRRPEKLYVVSWNTLLLYPTGYGSDQLTYTASLRLPRDGSSARSLHVPARAGHDITSNPFR